MPGGATNTLASSSPSDQIKATIQAKTSAGHRSGKTMSRQRCPRPAPSNSAASSSSFDNERSDGQSTSVVSGSECARHPKMGGKSVRSSVDRSFGRAWRTIWTADLVSIIAAFLLYILTIGDVRGFAFSLGLATVLDLITAYMFTRPIVFLLGRNRTIAEARWLGVSRGLAAVPAGGAA